MAVRPGPALRRPRPAAAVIDVEHGGSLHHVAVKRVGNARRFTLRVRSARHDVVLTMPARGSLAAARTFVLRHAAWIADRLRALSPAIPFAAGASIPLRGRLTGIVHRPGLRRRVGIEETHDGPLLVVSGPISGLAAACEDYLRSQARADLVAAVARHAATTGTQVRGLTLRDTRSRWGSCTARGSLSFSWRLILAPPFVLDYLAAHEVAHLVHLNHSAAFWTLTRRLFPDVEAAETWLKQHGSALHRYGARAGSTTEPVAGEASERRNVR